jgi:hypothetical protein
MQRVNSWFQTQAPLPTNRNSSVPHSFAPFLAKEWDTTDLNCAFSLRRPGSKPQDKPFHPFASSNPPQLAAKMLLLRFRITLIVLLNFLLQARFNREVHTGPVEDRQKQKRGPQSGRGWTEAQVSLPLSPLTPPDTPPYLVGSKNRNNRQKGAGKQHGTEIKDTGAHNHPRKSQVGILETASRAPSH